MIRKNPAYSLRDIEYQEDFENFYKANGLSGPEEKIACLSSRMGCPEFAADTPEETVSLLELHCLHGWDGDERIPEGHPYAPGRLCRHFKGALYEIVAVASHTESGEPLVIYRRAGDPARTFARPFFMFASPVDREKYPDAGQRLRFEPLD